MRGKEHLVEDAAKIEHRRTFFAADQKRILLGNIGADRQFVETARRLLLQHTLDFRLDLALDLIQCGRPVVIARASGAFIYMVALTGVTGARAELPPELARHLRLLRGITTKPICVGFGIGTAEQAEAVGRLADGVAVGSAIVDLVERHAGSPDLITKVGDFIAALKAPLRARDHA